MGGSPGREPGMERKDLIPRPSVPGLSRLRTDRETDEAEGEDTFYKDPCLHPHSLWNMSPRLEVWPRDPG